VRTIQRRMAPLFLALRDAAPTEPEARAVWQEIDERRAANMRKLARDLHDAGGLRAGLSVDEAADVIWATASSELYASSPSNATGRLNASSTGSPTPGVASSWAD
jgi:hypothetical protein